jgi:hypothetical protein
MMLMLPVADDAIGAGGGIAFPPDSPRQSPRPASPLAVRRALVTYRQSRRSGALQKRFRPVQRVLLCGDYMSMSFTEGAAESGRWAAQQIQRAAPGTRPV